MNAITLMTQSLVTLLDTSTRVRTVFHEIKGKNDSKKIGNLPGMKAGFPQFQQEQEQENTPH